MRLSIRGERIIDSWQTGPIERVGSISLDGGQKHDIVMEVYENTVVATAQLYWQHPNQLKEIVPPSRLFPVGPPAVAPTITTQPAAQSVSEGARVTFTVAATGTAPLNYHWSKDGVPLSNGGIVSGATTYQLVLDGVTSANAGQYRVVVNNIAGSVESTAANLTVSSAPASAPTITTSPANQEVTPGASPVFSVSVSGTAPFSYQWRKYGVAVAGKTDSTLSFPNVQVASAGRYDVVVTNGLGSATSALANLVVVTNIPTADDDGDGVSNEIEQSLGLNRHLPTDTNVSRYEYDRLGQLRRGPGGQYKIDAEGNIEEVRP